MLTGADARGSRSLEVETHLVGLLSSSAGGGRTRPPVAAQRWHSVILDQACPTGGAAGNQIVRNFQMASAGADNRQEVVTLTTSWMGGPCRAQGSSGSFGIMPLCRLISVT